ncbi:MAG: replicative DNA helicase, partial [Oscillospiraceae bacterium]|nr:replicative DNA helicase [Oscillospiraceae bacterium]
MSASITATELLGKELPYNLEAEQTVLGALLLNPETLPTVITILKPESFYREQHKAIFEVILQMFSNGQTCDVITVMNETVARGIFETTAMAKAYLKGIMEGVPTVANVASYCKIVEDKHLTRMLINVSRDIIEAASDGSENAKNLLDLAEQRIYDIRRGREVEGLTRLSEIVVSSYDKIQKLSGDDKDKYKGLRSGFTLLDTYTSGLNK